MSSQGLRRSLLPAVFSVVAQHFSPQLDTWTLARQKTRGMAWFCACLSFLGQGLNQRARISFIRAFPGCYAILTSPKKGETTVYGYNPALFWVLSVPCWCLAVRSALQYPSHSSYKHSLDGFSIKYIPL